MKKQHSGWMSPLMGGLISLAMGISALWVAFYADEISGGLPLLSIETNTVLGRIVFTAGGILCIWISTIAFRELWTALRAGKAK